MWWSDSGEDFPAGDGISTWNWLGEQIDESAEEKDQKNARVTMPIRSVPNLDADYDNAEGVPLDVALIGGRSSKLHPLISRARTWNEAVYHALVPVQRAHRRSGRPEASLRSHGEPAVHLVQRQRLR